MGDEIGKMSKSQRARLNILLKLDERQSQKKIRAEFFPGLRPEKDRLYRLHQKDTFIIPRSGIKSEVVKVSSEDMQMILEMMDLFSDPKFYQEKPRDPDATPVGIARLVKERLHKYKSSKYTVKK